MHDYLIDSARTDSGDIFHKELVPLDLLLSAINRRLDKNPDVDGCKKSLFYGRELSESLEHLQMQAADIDSFDYTEGPDVIHALLGIDTEAAELLEHLRNALIYGTPVDEAQVKNELGDLLWYIAKVCRHFDWTFEEVGEANLEKLRRRYPEKFDQALALNRNVSYEDQVFVQ